MNKFNIRIKHLSWKILSTLEFYLVLFPFGHLRPITPWEGYRLHKSNLGPDGQLLYLVHDRVMAPFVNKFGYWDIGISNFISKHINSGNSKQIFLISGLIKA